MDAAYTGSVICELRKKKGLTQQELADLLCVTNKAVSKWECGKNFPDLPMLQTLSEVLETSVSSLLGVEQPISSEAIAVLSAISQQEKKAIIRSLYLFIVLALLGSVLTMIIMLHSENPWKRLLLVLHFLILANGGALFEYLHKKITEKNGFRWPYGKYQTFYSYLRYITTNWIEKVRHK